MTISPAVHIELTSILPVLRASISPRFTHLRLLHLGTRIASRTRHRRTRAPFFPNATRSHAYRVFISFWTGRVWMIPRERQRERHRRHRRRAARKRCLRTRTGAQKRARGSARPFKAASVLTSHHRERTAAVFVCFKPSVFLPCLKHVNKARDKVHVRERARVPCRGRVDGMALWPCVSIN